MKFCKFTYREMSILLVMFCALALLSGCAVYRTDNCGITLFQPDYMKRDRIVTQEDLNILTRASELLSDESKWNKQPDRLCFYENTWSLFCALAKASVEVTGQYKHRRVAIQETRFTINDHFADRWSAHQLADFNSHTSTTFSDVQQVLAETLKRLNARYVEIK